MKTFAIFAITMTIVQVVAAETPNQHPPIDHSTIFEKSNQSVPDAELTQKSEVVTVLDTRGYTYMEVERENERIWLAAPKTEVKAGDTVHYPDRPVVLNHTSRTLNRTFPTVMFLSRVVVSSKD